MQKVQLNPTSNQTFEIEGQGEYNFFGRLQLSERLQAQGDIQGACNERFQALQLITELLPEDEELLLEWEHSNTQAALQILYSSAVDHLLISDFELSASALELLLDVDPEDHTGATELLALCYVALGEVEALEEVLEDISTKSPLHWVLSLWLSFATTGELSQPTLKHLRERFAPYYNEFCATSHPIDEEYISQIDSQNPSPEARARELWLQSEVVWSTTPKFIEALKA